MHSRDHRRPEGRPWGPLVFALGLTIAGVPIANAQPTHMPPGVFASPGRPPAQNPARAEEQRRRKQEQMRAQQERQSRERQRHAQEGGSK